MVGVFVFVLLMIVREGMETALLLSTLFLQQGERDLADRRLLGGVAAAALLAWAWTRYGRRINLARFFQVTAVFLLIFSLQLVVYTLHEFFEAGAVPFVDNEFWHIATEPYGPEGVYGEWLTYLMVLVPAAWLALRLAEGSPDRRAGHRTDRSLSATRIMYICHLQRDHRPRHRRGGRRGRALARGSCAATSASALAAAAARHARNRC